MLRRWVVVVSIVSLLIAGSAGAVGAITPEQTARGQARYRAICALCHGATGDGGLAPALAGPGSLAKFASVSELFGFASTTMPPEIPGSLATEEYLDIIAWLLSQSGVAADGQELSQATLATTPLKPSDALLPQTGRADAAIPIASAAAGLIAVGLAWALRRRFVRL